jgi:cysteinyl-tRNA synthetase
MSKSLGNFYTLRDLEKQGYNPLALKFLYLSSHYRNQLNFTFDSLNAMQKNLNDINLLIAKLVNYFSENKFDENQEKDLEKKTEELMKNIRDALDDNLNSPLALTYIYEFISYANSLLSQGLTDKKVASQIVDVFEDLDSIFGLFTFPEKISEDLEAKLWERYNARKIKDFATSDKLRKEFDSLGIVIGDIPNGFTVMKR